MNKTEISLLLSQEAGTLGYLPTRWTVNDEVFLKTTKSEPIPTRIDLQISLPSRIKIQIIGLNLSFGAIELQSIVLAKVPIHESVLHNLCQHKSQNDTIKYGRIWNSNTEITIDLNFNDPLYWHMVHNRPTEYNK